MTVALARRLIVDAPWAQERLRPFAGQRIEWDLAGVRGAVVLDAEGLPQAPPGPAAGQDAASGATAATADARATSRHGVTLYLAADDLPALSDGLDALMRRVSLSGNAGLAAELAFIARNLKPEPEEWLAPWIGDVLAQRAGSTVRTGAAWALDAGRRAAAAGTEFAIHEARLLPAPDLVDRHCRSVDELRDATDRLAQRIARLEGRR